MKFIKLTKKNLITFKGKTLHFLKKHSNFLLIIQVSIVIGIETSSITIPTQVACVLTIGYLHFRNLQNKVDQLGDYVEAVINDRMIREYAEKFHKRYEVSFDDLEYEYRESGNNHSLSTYHQITLEYPIILDYEERPIEEYEKFRMEVMVPPNMTPREVETYVQRIFAESQEIRRPRTTRSFTRVSGIGSQELVG